MGGHFRPDQYLINTPKLDDSLFSVSHDYLVLLSVHHGSQGLDLRFRCDKDDPSWRSVDVHRSTLFSASGDAHIVAARAGARGADVTYAYVVDGITKTVVCTIELSRVGWRVTRRRDTMFVPRIRRFPPR